MKFRMLQTTITATVLALGVFVGPALAEYPPAEPPEVNGEVIEKEKDEKDDEVAVAQPPTAVSEMPVTGSDAVGLTATGVALLALGSLALRRRSPSSES